MKFELKALIMLLITTAATTISDTGFPNGIGWAVLGISLLGTGLVHAAQSFALPTTSIPGQFDYRDLLKGAIVSVGNFLSLFAASYLPGSAIKWQDMAQSAGMVFIMYIIKQLATKPPVKG